MKNKTQEDIIYEVVLNYELANIRWMWLVPGLWLENKVVNWYTRKTQKKFLRYLELLIFIKEQEK